MMKKIGLIIIVCIAVITFCYIFLRHDLTESVVKFSNSKEMNYIYQAKEGASNLIMRFDGKADCDIQVILTSNKDENLKQEFVIKKQKLKNHTIRTDWYYPEVRVTLKSVCLDNDVTLTISSY